MKYLYYPGCSLEGSAREYDLSTRAVMDHLGVALKDVADWTCCGASAAEATSRLLALALPARNLSLAEQMTPDCDLLVPCSACYLNLKKTADMLQSDPQTKISVNTILAEEKLSVTGSSTVRHLLDVMATDIGPKQVAGTVTRLLTGIIAAPYYGCQCLRPYGEFDDPETPTSMDALLAAVGVRTFEWSMGTVCCGASNMNTKPQVGLALTGTILKAARGADAIVTVCPMCQMNLEAYQKKISNQNHQDLSVTVIYLPQLLGLAMGLEPPTVGLHLNLAVTKRFKKKLAAACYTPAGWDRDQAIEV